MTVDFESVDDICILRLEGRFATGRDSEYLRSKTDELRGRGYHKIIADFAHVSYIDSTGIGFLVAIYTSVIKEEGGKFALASPNHRVREVLELTKLDTILPVYNSEADALAALRSK
jgi:anti-anti-sigma factor